LRFILVRIFLNDGQSPKNNLALAYTDRIQGERVDNLECAIKHYQLALEVRTREDFPVDWAETQNNLGFAYADRTCGEHGDNLKHAIHHYQLALQIRTRETNPINHRMTLNNLANLYFDDKRWREAYQTCLGVDGSWIGYFCSCIG